MRQDSKKLCLFDHIFQVRRPLDNHLKWFDSKRSEINIFVIHVLPIQSATGIAVRGAGIYKNTPKLP